MTNLSVAAPALGRTRAFVPAPSPTVKPSTEVSSAGFRTLRPRWHTRLPVWLFSTLIAAALYLGWQGRGDGHITGESGLGYVLGIVGASLMLLLLLYPLRKHLRAMRHWGAIRHWFRIHQLFGILGPVLILFHAGFQFGSLNSNVALVSMLTVAASGLVGRYVYTKIHYGLYGKRATLQQLLTDTELEKRSLHVLFAAAPQLQARLQKYEAAALAPTASVYRGAQRLLSIGLRTTWTHARLRADLRRGLRAAPITGSLSRTEIRRLRRDSHRHLAEYLVMVRKVVELSFYERVFSLWHLLHLPLFLMLVVAGTVHVIAVHMY